MRRKFNVFAIHPKSNCQYEIFEGKIMGRRNRTARVGFHYETDIFHV